MALTLDQMLHMLAEEIAKVPVIVTVTESQHSIIIELDVDQEYRGRLIGKKGRTIEALRVIGRAMGSGTRTVKVEVLEDC